MKHRAHTDTNSARFATGLFAGGNQIRTIGPAEASGVVMLSVLVRADFSVSG
jgi:hypothetical protein